MSEALMMYSVLTVSNPAKSQLNKANFMWSDLQGLNLRESALDRTIFVEAKLTNTKIEDLDKSKVLLKFTKFEGTAWQ